MCFIVLLGLAIPRVVLFFLWLFRGQWIDAAIQPWWLGFLGLLILPYTTLAYVLVHHNAGTVDGLGHLIILALAFLLDTGTWGGASRRRPKRDD